MTDKYMVSRNGKESGPFPFQAIANGIKSGKVFKTDHVWKDGMDEWVVITAVSEFTEFFPVELTKVRIPPPKPAPPAPIQISQKSTHSAKKVSIKDFEEEEEENNDEDDNEELIRRLSVSDSWKELFLLVDKAGGPDLSKIDNLKAKDRTKVKSKLSFNIPAFLFGPLYYFVKGMWKKGFTIFLINCLCFWCGGIVGNILASIFANKDYYRKMIYKESFWW